MMGIKIIWKDVHAPTYSPTLAAPSIAGGEAMISHALWPKNQNIKQKQYCNKFNEDSKNDSHKKKIWKIRHEQNANIVSTSSRSHPLYDPSPFKGTAWKKVRLQKELTVCFINTWRQGLCSQPLWGGGATLLYTASLTNQVGFTWTNPTFPVFLIFTSLVLQGPRSPPSLFPHPPFRTRSLLCTKQSWLLFTLCVW